MAEALALTRLTNKQIDVIVERMRGNATALRHDLLKLYDGEAHIVKGYASFVEYVVKELGLHFNANYLDILRLWARVEIDVFGPDLSHGKGLTKQVAVDLARLPSEERKPAYDEAIMLIESGPINPRDVVHIVNRRLAASAPAVETAPKNKPKVEGCTNAPPSTKVASGEPLEANTAVLEVKLEQEPSPEASADLPAEEEPDDPPTVHADYLFPYEDEEDDLYGVSDDPPTVHANYLSVSLHPDDAKSFCVTGIMPNGALVVVTVPFTPVATLERSKRAQRKRGNK